MDNTSICRIGVFYDGYYFDIGRKHLYRDIGWLQFKPFHRLIENCIREKEPHYSQYHVVYAAWFQGMNSSDQVDEKQLKDDRRLCHDLMHAGIEPKFMPMPQSGSNEKGTDVALAIDAMQLALDGKIDIAILVTGDGDFVPLVRALTKHAVRVMAAHLDYDDGQHKDFVNPRLLNACNYSLNINRIATDKHYGQLCNGLFARPDSRTPDQAWVTESQSVPVPSGNIPKLSTPALILKP
jgi:uncharacterized LabA/DUF88 family protein